MFQTVFAVAALGTLATGLAPAPEEAQPPHGQPPRGAAAKVVGETVEMTDSAVVYRKETRAVTELVGGRTVVRTIEVAVPQVTVMKKVVPLASVQAHGTDGKPIDAKRLRELLVNHTAVLVSADGRPVDPFYLRLLKDGTVILVVGEKTDAPVPAPPIPR